MAVNKGIVLINENGISKQTFGMAILPQPLWPTNFRTNNASIDLPKYNYEFSETYLVYEFVSDGPQGKIRKVVRFVKVDDNTFNLGFGDLNEQTGRVDDLVVTDNNDTAKVLATVAETVYAFYNHYPDATVLIKGSTASRTRMYKIGMVNNWHEISATFDVYGLVHQNWESFEAKGSYDAFLIRLKET